MSELNHTQTGCASTALSLDYDLHRDPQEVHEIAAQNDYELKAPENTFTNCP